MSDKRTLIALSTAIALGILGASAAMASERDETGGFRIGPLGQVMGTPSEWGAKGAPAGASAYGLVHRRRTRSIMLGMLRPRTARLP
jgi:hypothetical protein